MKENQNTKNWKPLYQKMVDVVNETGSSAKSTALLISGHNLLFNGEFDGADGSVKNPSSYALPDLE